MHSSIARIVRRSSPAPLVTLAMLLGACSDVPGQAQLDISIYGEEFIEDRIPADAFVDGWEVEFDHFLIAIGELEADGSPLGGTLVRDLAVPTDGEGHGLATVGLPPGGSPLLDFRVAPVPEDTHATTYGAMDASPILEAGASLIVEGVAAKDDQTVSFAWAFTTDTHYVDCQSTAVLVDGEDAHTQLTIHADHLFYDDLDSEEPNVAFDLVASADADADGEVTEAELRAVDITGQSRYQVGSRDITDLWSFIEAQTSTLGHIDGEGHCELGS